MSKEVCNHCWHAFRRAFMMVLPNGYVLQECCKCHEHRTIHADHAYTKSNHTMLAKA
jgi:hypothetical protein